MWPFKRKQCEHPFDALAVEYEQTIKREAADYDAVTYHLFCRACHAPLQITHAKLVGGVDGFLA